VASLDTCHFFFRNVVLNVQTVTANMTATCVFVKVWEQSTADLEVDVSELEKRVSLAHLLFC
jgi:hypothetical protein